MKVLNIVEEGRLGGPQRRIVGIASELQKNVVTTVVLPIDDSLEFRDLCDKKGVPYVKLPISRITKDIPIAIRYLAFSIIEIIRLAIFFRARSETIVHVSGGSWQFKGVIAGRIAQKKIVWHLNDTSMPGFIRANFKFLSRFSHGYIFASQRSKEYYGGLVSPSKPQFVIPAPVDLSYFYPGADFIDLAEVMRSWGGKVVVGMVANINRVKGLETFIQMAAESNRSLENVQFVVVGPVFSNQRKYYESLRNLASELSVTNIEFVGAREDVRPLLKRFDIYVCSSNAESSPISVWEAMAMALPVVSTDVGDVPLYVKDGENGYIAPVGDHKALAKHVCELTVDKGLRLRLGKAARIKVSENMDITRCAERHLEAYQAILDEH